MSDSSLNRRQFLNRTGRTAAALAAGATVSRVTRPARAGGLGANDTIRIGAIGVGGQGRFNMGVFLKNKDVAFPVVCDVNQRHREAANRELLDGKADVVEDYRSVLDRKDIDAVLVCTPDHWHAIPTIHACQAEKDVYVEKPIAHNVVEGRRMVEAARKHDRVVQVGTQQLSGPHYLEVAELIQSGRIGKITHVETWNVSNNLPGAGRPADEPAPATLNWDFWRGPAPMIPYNRVKASGAFRFFWDTAGGTLTDWGTHHTGTVQQIMKAIGPKSVMATGGKYAIDDILDTPDTLHVLWEYPDDWTLTYTLRHANGHSPYGSGYGIVFYGADATMYLDRSGYEIIPQGNRSKAATFGKPRVDNFMPAELSVPHIRNFLDCVKSRKRPAADVEIGHRATVVPHLGNVALKAGRRIHWDARREQIIGDKDAERFLTRDYRKPYVLPEV